MENIEILGKHKGLLITHLNIHSLWNKIYIARTTFTMKDVDTITLFETWLTNQIPDDLIDFEGYTVYRKDRSWSEGGRVLPKKGGGVCIYIKDTLNVRTGHLNQLESSTVDIECQCIEILCPKQKNVIVLNIISSSPGKNRKFYKIS